MREIGLIFFGIGLIIFGCGVQNNPPKKETVLIPEKIAVEIPKAFTEPSVQYIQKTQTTKHSKIEVEPHGGISEGYQRLVTNTLVIEELIKRIKFNIILENTVMPEIQKLCESVPLNVVCTIPSNSVELNVTEALISEYEKLYPKAFDINEEVVGKTISFGLMEFVRYDNNQSYQYALNANLTEIYNQLYTKAYIFDTNYKQLIQNVQWSEDNHTVLSTLDTGYEEKISEYPWTLHYKKAPSIEETMHLFHKSLVAKPEQSLMLNFDLTTKEDENKTTIFKMNDIQETFSFDSLSYYTLSSYGELNQAQGFERYSRNEYDNIYGDTKYRQDEVFDVNGTNIASSYCSDSEYDECALYDRSTWYIDSNDSSLFEPFKDIGFNELKITGGNLEEGEYFLMKPDFNLSNPSAQEVLAQNIGSFLVFKESRQGAIYDSSLLESLNDLPILYAKYNQVLKVPLVSREVQLFEKVKASDTPELTLYP
ncbi:MAG: Unknown protein [uncultured Sulfurovum sp.]|uniref:Uncharacterized protein n=1 Tax=uncultured Sulfurovum sp. TaxID=269237 RepID=A0A6S6TGZ3_9BACT|nr:MAG: Unknown protein [uncultured Sulfurovum sp.]